jgi:hypothetical protein
MHKEQKVAILIVWTIISVTTAIIVVFPFFAERQTVLKNSPTCISKSQFNVDCSLCGMTRAFIEISNGNFINAYVLNKGSLFVYSSFVLNFAIFVTYLIYDIKLKIQKEYIDDT